MPKDAPAAATPPAPDAAPAYASTGLVLVAPLLALVLGHVLSNALRTTPGIAADVLIADLAVSAEGLAGLTGSFNLAFALCQIPVGVALDRFGVRRVSITLFCTTVVGSIVAALATGPLSFLLGQLLLGAGCSGMLLCPVTYAARRLTAAQFGLWSGLIQAIGNSGMLLSATPLAYLIDAAGWRAGYAAGTLFGLVALALVILLVRDAPPPGPYPSLLRDGREVIRLGLSRPLRAGIVIAFASFAAGIGVRGLWGGPWLMEVKGLPRTETGNILILCALAFVVGPVLSGMLDRRFGHRRLVLATGHLAAAACLVLIVLGGPSGPLGTLPAAWDLVMFVAFALTISVQPLVFAVVRSAVASEQAGKALSAANLSYFTGAAVIQAASGPVVAAAGIGAGLLFLAAMLTIGTLLFLWMTRRPA
jgi:MFS family permease